MNLLKIAFLATVIGILILAILSQNLEPKSISISKIDLKMLDNYVKISASIKEVIKTDSITILTIKDLADNSEITAIMDKGDVLKGENVEIIGRVIEYNESLEIEIEKLKII
ncbi:hypothetical protein COS75_01310 [Candidatus Pacearchaeota archaeon CG06_land_8_20_14_3_00_35_12]|nr:MAG: hypothetical protein COS75_01310 [Candidatus Pacearchaeota archaeon CG06_land_8_20_14_3_00_35_12]